ncbi:MAG: NAD(P)-dependent oxidoreductase [Acidobacteria bacterium]|nr:NAD(P)-dependent oxidoreductase [Acidobacteriota bacterium]
MKIAVTGALGHIGSRFIHNLQPGDYEEVLLLDNLHTQRFCSLFNLPHGVPFHFVQDDVCAANLESHFRDKETVIHLAAVTDAEQSFDRKDEVERVNFEGTRRVAEACAACGCKLIFLSTTSVYGMQEEVVDESCPLSALKPQSPYAASKLRAEQMLQAMGENNRLRFITCRFGTVFGTSIGMRFHTAINKFVWQACAGLPITVWRTALHQSRPYLDLDDGIRALKFILKNDCFDNDVYNVLTANATVGEIVGIIQTCVPDATIEYVDSPIMNQLSYEVMNDKFRSLGFRFEGSLEKGIASTVRLLCNMSWLPPPGGATG